jgi:hypothetical protein
VMIGGPVVPQSPSGPRPTIPRRRHGRGAIARRSASACLSVCRETPERVINAAAQPPADFLRPSRPPLVWGLQLAIIAQPVAVATCEHAPEDVQPENPAAAVLAREPRPLSAKPARCPAGGDGLIAAPAVRRCC